MANESTSLSLFNPAGLEASLAKCEVLIKSGLVPKAFTKPESVLVACTFGEELGFSPMQSIQLINIIDNKPTISAAGMQALCVKHGGHIKVIEWTDKICTIEVSRPGREPHQASYSVIDAGAQGLLGKSNWVKMPKQMLFARVSSAAIRMVFADVLAGIYTTEEMDDSSSAPAPKAPAPKAKPVAIVEDVKTIEGETTVVLDIVPFDLDSEKDQDAIYALWQSTYPDVPAKKEKIIEKCKFLKIHSWAAFDGFLASFKTKE
jgi:hypothetical protein